MGHLRPPWLRTSLIHLSQKSCLLGLGHLVLIILMPEYEHIHKNILPGTQRITFLCENMWVVGRDGIEILRDYSLEAPREPHHVLADSGRGEDASASWGGLESHCRSCRWQEIGNIWHKEHFNFLEGRFQITDTVLCQMSGECFCVLLSKLYALKRLLPRR